ncbi:MAG: oligosaccharide flippase family protein [Chitinophagaceae bacterium]|nr:oligosaccharide flippase family protein [Chitinophagaceae bacterium]
MATISGILKFGKSREMRSVAIYTFSNFFSKGVSFLLLFYFAHALTEADFGLLNLFSNGILFLMPFVSMGILQSVNTEYFKKDNKEFSNFFSTTLMMPMIVTLLAILLFFVFRTQLQQRYSFPTVFALLIPLITLFNFLNEHLINMVRNSNDPMKYLFVNIGRLLAEITLAVFFISALEFGWMGRVMGIFISYFMVAMYAFFYFKERGFIVPVIRKKYIYNELLYSVPIIVMQVGVFCMGSSAGYFIEYFTHDFAQVGVFSIAATFGSIIIVLCTAMLQYTYPKIYSLLSEQRINYAAIRWHLLFYAGVMLLGTGIVIIATPIAYNIMLKQSYQAGLSYYFFICFGYFFWSISYFLYAFMLYNKEKRKILFASLLSVIVSVVSHTLFIKYLGAYGAAVSMCVVYFIVLLITIFFVRKYLTLLFSNNLSKAV